MDVPDHVIDATIDMTLSVAGAYGCILEPRGSRSRIQGSDSKKRRVSVHVVCAWVLDLYYGVHGFDSFTGGLFMAV
ncbi:hypothetical protein Tco_0369544 [Tanacetum coccineum]